MSGLLDLLDTALENLDLEELLGGVIGELGEVGGAVELLVSGPGVVTELIEALDDPPTPEGLDGLDAFSGSVTGALALIPADTSGPLAPLLTPFQSLNLSANIGVTATGISAAIRAIREIVTLATGRVAPGAEGWPDGGTGAIDIAQVRSVLEEVEGTLDELSGFVDPSRMLELLQRFGPASRDLRSRWPALPIAADMLQAFDAVGRWEAMTPAELQAHLATTISNTARLIAEPRARVIQPALDAATVAGAGSEQLSRAHGELTPLLAALADRVRAGGRPSPAELGTLVERTRELEQLCAVLPVDDSPLATIEQLPSQVELQFMRVLRVVHPALDKADLEARARALVEGIPAAPEAPLGDLVSELEALDLSVITDPLSTVREAIEGAVGAAEEALETVRESLEELLRPVAEGISAALQAIHFEQITGALADLPETIEGFVDDEIRTRLTSLEEDVSGAVTAVSEAVERFDPEAIKAGLREKVEMVASVLDNDQVRAVFGAVEVVLDEVVAALESFSPGLSTAADESVALLDQVREAAAAIDPALIPDALKPTLRQAVDAVVDIDIAGEAEGPINTAVDAAVTNGVLPILEEFEDLVGELRTRIESFRPSELIGDSIEQPFLEIIDTLDDFQPSDLLGEIESALGELREAIHVVDPDELLGPLLELHQQISGAIAALDPDTLLAPVEEAIQGAVRELMETSGFGEAFDGVQEFLEDLNDWVDLLEHAQNALVRIADGLEQPAALEAQLDALVAGAVARVGEVDMAALAAPLEQARIAAESIDHRRVAAQLAPALRRASELPDALVAAETRALIAAVRDFPVELLSSAGAANLTLARRLARLRPCADALEAAVDPWHALGPRLARMAGNLETELRGYALLTEIDGRHVLADFLEPPTQVTALQTQVDEALRESLRLPAAFLHALYGALAPYAGGFARDLGNLLGAVHAKVDSITGEDGLLGTVSALDDLIAMLEGFDLSPVSDPLRTQIYEPVAAVVAAIDPAPLRDALAAVQEALESLLSLTNLFQPETIDELDETYASAVEKLAALSPRSLVIDAVDPVYQDMLDQILPVLDLPTRLRASLEEISEELPDEIVTQLRRIEEAFDALLNALPLQPSGGQGASVSVSASASIGS